NEHKEKRAADLAVRRAPAMACSLPTVASGVCPTVRRDLTTPWPTVPVASARRGPAGAHEGGRDEGHSRTRFPLNQHVGGLFLPGCFRRQIGHPRLLVNHLITLNVGLQIVIVMNMKNAGRPGFLRPVVECRFQYQPIAD